MKRIICMLFGHRYFVTKRFGKSTRQVKCKCCKQLWLMNDPTQSFLPWDYESQQIANMSRGIWP